MALILIVLFFILFLVSASAYEAVPSIFFLVLSLACGFWIYSAVSYKVEVTTSTIEVPIYSITTDKNFQLGYSNDVYKFYVKNNEGAFSVNTAPIESPLYMSDDVEPHILIIETTYEELPWYLYLAVPPSEENYNKIEYKIYVPNNTIKLDFDSGG